jgi:hypothetical protein
MGQLLYRYAAFTATYVFIGGCVWWVGLALFTTLFCGCHFSRYFAVVTFHAILQSNVRLMTASKCFHATNLTPGSECNPSGG